MGVNLPALSVEDRDSICHWALWALKNKPSPDGSLPVEIPEMSTPEIKCRISELRMVISILYV